MSSQYYGKSFTESMKKQEWLFAHTPQGNGFMDMFTSRARQMGKTHMYTRFIQEIILKRNAKLKQVDPDLCATLRQVRDAC